MNDKNTTVEDLKEKFRDFSRERDWTIYEVSEVKNFSMALTVEAAELMEIFQWTHPDKLKEYVSDPAVATHIKEEIADVFWYLMRVCDCCGVDLTEAVFDKATKNAVKYPPKKEESNSAV